MLNNLKICLILCCNLCILLAYPANEEVTPYPDYEDATFYHVEEIVTEYPVYVQPMVIPEYIPRCRDPDQDFNECIRDVLQEMVEKTVNGIPEINIPTMDPAEIRDATYKFNSPFIVGKVNVKKANVSGLRNIVFKNVTYKGKGEKFTMKIEYKLPYLLIHGHYNVNVLYSNGTKMDSKGGFVISINNIESSCELVGEWYEYDVKKKNMYFSDLYLKRTLSNIFFYVTGPLPDPDLNNAVIEPDEENLQNVPTYLLSMATTTWIPDLIIAANEYVLQKRPFSS